MIDIDKMAMDIKAYLEARVHEGYGYGTLAATVVVYPLNSAEQERVFDARDYAVEYIED